VKTSHQTYQRIIKAVAGLLLAALFVPSGLHAKQFVDFCKTSTAEQPMAADHSCCEEPEQSEDTDTHQHHDCGWGFICACNLGESELNDKDWVISNINHFVVLNESDNHSILFETGELIPRDQQIRIGQHAPPLWLVYDTFLI
jgi:hypothetical protein